MSVSSLGSPEMKSSGTLKFFINASGAFQWS